VGGDFGHGFLTVVQLVSEGISTTMKGPSNTLFTQIEGFNQLMPTIFLPIGGLFLGTVFSLLKSLHGTVFQFKPLTSKLEACFPARLRGQEQGHTRTDETTEHDSGKKYYTLI
jgi:hypothetical protein